MKEIQDAKARIEEKTKTLVEAVKGIAAQYDLKAILVQLYVFENFEIFDQKKRLRDDPLLVSFVADLHVSTHDSSEKVVPNTEESKHIIELLSELHLTYLSQLLLSGTPDNMANRVRADFLLVKRSFFQAVFWKFTSIFLAETASYFIEKHKFDPTIVLVVKHALVGLVVARLNDRALDPYFALDFTMAELAEKTGIDQEPLRAFVEFFSTSSANNQQFLPRRDNPIVQRPIILLAGKTYCVSPLSLLENVRYTVEAELRNDTNDATSWGRYCKKRGKLLEELISTELGRLVPNAKLYSGLLFSPVGPQQTFELDLLVEVDKYLLIVEAKAGGFSEGARGGRESRLERDTTSLIHDAHEQCLRALDYINSNDTALFTVGQKELRIRRADYESVFLLSVTLENLEILTANIHEILKIPTDVTVVTLSLYDLVVIADILRGPAEFLLYLQRRGRSIEQGKIHAHDELDILSAFLFTGLLFPEEEAFNIIDVTNFSDDIEKYYLLGPKKAKIPRFQANHLILKLVEECERCGRHGAQLLANELISFATSAQNTIAANIQNVIRRTQKKGKSDFSITTRETNVGMTFWSSKEALEGERPPHIVDYVKAKLSQTRTKMWFLIVVDGHKGRLMLDCCLYE